MAFAGIKTTPVKKVPPSNSTSLCRICGSGVHVNGGFFSLVGGKLEKENILQRIAELFGVEDDNLSVGPHILCKKCFRRIERYEATLKELTSLKETYRNNLALWKNDANIQRTKRCSSSPGFGVKKSRPPSCARNVRRSLNVEAPVMAKTATVHPVSEDGKENMELALNPGRIEVILDYETGRRCRIPKDDTDRKAIKQLVLGEYGYAVNALYSKQIVRDELVRKVCGTIKEECKELCSTKNPSILRNVSPAGLKQFTESAHVAELADRAPVLHAILSSVGKNPTKKDNPAVDEQGTSMTSDQDTKNVPAISMAAAVLLKSRCPQMSVQAYRVSTVLWHSGAKKQVYNRGAKWGFTVSHPAAIEKVEQLGKHYDEKVLKWKVEQERHKKFHMTLETISESLEECETPLFDANLKQEVKEKMCMHFDEAVYNELSEQLSNTVTPVDNLDEKIKLLEEKNNSNRPNGYQVIGDNVDLMIKVRHQASDKPNKSIHWFHLNAVKDRVNANECSNDGPLRKAEEVENWEVLPSSKDTQDLLHDFIPLFARVITHRIPAFKHFKDVVVRHIPHQYSDVMKEKSEQAPLGLMFKNENSNDDMIQILTELHEKYLPLCKTTDESGNVEVDILQKVFFGGDQLTEERARNARQGRADGDSEFERLEGFIPKVEDWHVEQVLYQVLYDVFFDSSSVCDVGTMCSNMNVINQVNAKTSNVLDNFNYCKNYVKLETDAFIAAATMKHFGMTNLEDPVEEFIPASILQGTQTARRLWLHEQVKQILKKTVMDDQEQFHQSLRDEVIEMNRPKVYHCSVCNKEYRYAKARDNHEAKVHSVNHPCQEETRNSANTPESQEIPTTESKTDAKYNYASARLNFGMIVFNFDDAVKEGDGERILRCWKFMMLIFRAYKHTKYAFAALQLFFFTACLLSERLSHLLKWNRTVNNHGGKGRNISLDLRLEHLNHLLKEMLKCLGVNVTQKSAQRCSEAISILEEMLDKMDVELGLKQPSGHHISAKDDKDFTLLVKEIHERGDLFTFTPERNYQKYSDFKRNILGGLDFSQLNKWLNTHKKEFSRLQQ